jgi:Ribosomal_S17 N-terminal
MERATDVQASQLQSTVTGQVRLCMMLTTCACHAMQTEKAFQKQLGVNGGWVKPARRTPGKGGLRFYKNVGLGFKTPKEAIEGGYSGGTCWQ